MTTSAARKRPQIDAPSQPAPQASERPAGKNAVHAMQDLALEAAFDQAVGDAPMSPRRSLAVIAAVSFFLWVGLGAIIF